jgi:SAM-dependent methyltransferase
MASIRKKLSENINNSSNTRMDLASAGILGNWRPDELTHMSRYDKIASLAIEESKRLKRPIRILEIGCGEVWPMRVIYKAYTVKKSDIVEQYIGYDIDPTCQQEHRYWPHGGEDIHDSAWFKTFNGEVRIQDLTVNPLLDIPDDSIDFFYTTEVIEHMERQFVEPWLVEAHRALREGGVAYVSTPNHDGSNDKLPEDHVYEWGYNELFELLDQYFTVEDVVGTFIQLPKFKRAQKEAEEKRGHYDGWTPEQVRMIRNRFGRQWERVILAMPYPHMSNNCAWTLRKSK